MTMPDYLIRMGSLHNLRAVEAYPTVAGGRMRGNRLYRAGAWERITEADRAWLDANVQTILDLRHPDEINSAAEYRTGEPPASVVFHSIFREDVPLAQFTAELNGLHGSAISADRYLHYLKVGAAERFARSIELLAEEDRYPVLINCTAGKDRTGILVAMAMELVGVDDETIASEYERSNADIDGLINYLEQVGRTPQGTPEEIRSRMETPADKMHGFLEGVRKEHGSVADLLASHGVKDDTFEALREQLLE
ncbi:MAG: tyrosine-protein phosphatase [Chloroflexi bacterium]|nr:tyrosine-protein phosphatase [Chloroflexota bacterium]MDA1147197.1 tyrosine-protein phosphatase [Chloroflexota bacterium]